MPPDRQQTIEQHKSLAKEVKELVKQEAERLSKHYPAIAVVEGATKIREKLYESRRYHPELTEDERAVFRIAVQFAVAHSWDDEVVWAGNSPRRWFEKEDEKVFLSKAGELVCVHDILQDEAGSAPPQDLYEVSSDDLLERYKEFTFESDATRNEVIDTWYQMSARVEKLLRS